MGEWFEEWFNEDYLKVYSHRNQADAEEQVGAMAHLLVGKTVLDVGCGTGRHALVLTQRGFEVTGIDLSPTMLDKAKELVPQATFLRRDMRDLSGLGPFDNAVSFFTSFGYFDKRSDDQKVLNEIAHCVKHVFFLDTIDPSHINREDSENVTRRIEGDRVIKTISVDGRTYKEKVRLYSAEELEEMLEMAGFVPTRIDHPDRLQFVGRKR